MDTATLENRKPALNWRHMRIAIATLGLLSAVLLGCGPVHTCSDGIQNGSETAVDCGGTCGACALGFTCSVDRDCSTGFCGVDHRCTPDVTTLPSSAGASTFLIDPGVGIVVQPGTQAGYGITANVGASYRLIWTGDRGTSGTYREFTGTVWTGGTFDSLTPGCADNACPLENDDFLSAVTPVSGGAVITFDTFTTTGLDGFDFTATTEPVFFDLNIDGQAYPTLVFFPSAGAASNPDNIPFGLSTGP
jgi:hypothetical protein